MDISAHPKLDPKLKDTYDRIMGTSVGTKTTKPAPHHEEVKSVAKKTTVEPSAPIHHGHISHLAYSASNPKKETHEQVPAKNQIKHEDSLLFPIIMGVGGVLFFVFYAIFWISYFGLS